MGSWDSSGSIAVGYRLDDLGLIPGKGGRFFLQPHQIWGQQASCPMGTWDSFPRGGRLKWAGCKVDHSSPSTAEVKNGAATAPLPHMTSWSGA
jgi:hypothetical protein